MSMRSLPVELEREIFETAALSEPTVIPTLILVAQRVLVWIEPFQYRVVIAGQHPKILEAIKSKPPEFFATAVRHLFLDGYTGWTTEDAMQVLSVSSGVKDFAAIGDFSCPRALDLLSNMQVERMALCLAVIFGAPQLIDLTHGSFAHVTHIDIFDEIEEDDTVVLPQISLLPALTHLCLNNAIPWSVTQRLLQECPRLQLFIILWPSSSRIQAFSWSEANPVRDPRVVIALFSHYWGEWEDCARGLPTFWSRAENFIARKKRGEVDENRYWMDDESYEEWELWRST